MAIRIMKTLVKLCNWLLIGLGILLSIQALSEYSRGPNLYRGVNHKVTGLDNSTKSFSYIVFSDPQYGLLDIVDDKVSLPGEGDESRNQQYMCFRSPNPDGHFACSEGLLMKRPQS